MELGTCEYEPHRTFAARMDEVGASGNHGRRGHLVRCIAPLPGRHHQEAPSL